MADYPPLSRFYVASYAANDRDYPVVAIRLDPRTAGYKVPEDLSPHPDSKRYPNHVFTGAQPASGDQIVTHVYEILPSPWVPFTRYDDDLGPVQGRRRAVKNEGQQADLVADKKVSYEGRDGSAIVSNEIEETWSIKTDDDGNSLFPIRDRDFYDASRGAVQERRQLFVPTGEEQGTLENVNGVITQTSYEPYNEFLSVKIVQTYSVDGPQLIGKTTNNEGQLATVTTQRKGSLNYTPPAPSATKTVEVSREDSESLIERIIDTPEVFSAVTFSSERPDPTPEKFRVKIPAQTFQSTGVGEAVPPILGSIDLSRSEQQVTKFVKRTSATQRSIPNNTRLTSKTYTSELGGGIASVDEFISNNPAIDNAPTGNSVLDAQSVKENNPELGTIYKTGLVSAESEALGDDRFLKRIVKLDSIGELFGQDYDESLDIRIPFSQKIINAKTPLEDGPVDIQPRDVANSLRRKYDVDAFAEQIEDYYWELPDLAQVNLPNRLKSASVVFSKDAGFQYGDGEGTTYYWRSGGSSAVAGEMVYDVEEGYSGSVPATKYIFFLQKATASISNVIAKIRAKDAESGRTLTKYFPNVRPTSHSIAIVGGSISIEAQESVSLNSSSKSGGSTINTAVGMSRTPPTIHPIIPIFISSEAPNYTPALRLNKETTIVSSIRPKISISGNPFSFSSPYTLQWSEGSSKQPAIPATEYTEFPDGRYLVAVNSSPYRFGYIRIEALVADIFSPYVGDNASLVDPNIFTGPDYLAVPVPQEKYKI
jgi:hypothetical protein